MFRKLRMVVSASALMVLAMTAVPAAASPRDTATVKLVEKVMPSVVSIAKKDDGTLEVWGAGVIIDDRGYVLTCHHVIKDIDTIAVGFSDGAFLPAELVWKDGDNDLAVVRVKAKRAFPEARLGPADLKIGEPLVTIGHPAGNERTVTRGILSKLDDITHNKKTFRKAIQTDSPINGGNSGGPLFNAEGDVVGIAFLRLRLADGIAWAINVDQATRKLAIDCSAKKMAGIEHGIVAEEKLVGKEGPERRGVFIRRTVEKSAADKAGLKRDDRILKVRCKEGDKTVERMVHSRFDLERSMWKCHPRDEVTVTVLREGKEVQVALTLEGPGIEREDD